MKVIIDTREQGRITEYFSEIKDLEIEEKELLVGDIYFPEKDIVIERKRIEDFWASLLSGHLQKQAFEMMQNEFKGKFLIIEGKYNEFAKNVFARGGFYNPASMNGFKVSLTCKYGINIIEVQDTKQFARTCISIASMFGEGIDHVPVKKLKFDDSARAISMLTALDGISSSSAKKLLKKFGSIKNLMEKTPEEIMETDGFAEKKAGKFVSQLQSIINTEYKEE